MTESFRTAEAWSASAAMRVSRGLLFSPSGGAAASACPAGSGAWGRCGRLPRAAGRAGPRTGLGAWLVPRRSSSFLLVPCGTDGPGRGRSCQQRRTSERRGRGSCGGLGGTGRGRCAASAGPGPGRGAGAGGAATRRTPLAGGRRAVSRRSHSTVVFSPETGAVHPEWASAWAPGTRRASSRTSTRGQACRRGPRGTGCGAGVTGGHSPRRPLRSSRLPRYPLARPRRGSRSVARSWSMLRPGRKRPPPGTDQAADVPVAGWPPLPGRSGRLTCLALAATSGGGAGG